MPDASVTVPAREVPVIAQADVVVVGAGVGGFCAALAAARNGSKTILLERNAFPGGVATAGLMCSVTNFSFGCLTADRPVNVVCGSGKNASTEPRGLLRGQMTCMMIGQAAGTAAALAAQTGVPVNMVDVPALQAALVAQGMDLGEDD